ncbi:MAG: hypothetical protein MUC34_13300, partial [Anaerolineae bacterium]|nr:hypothetical protein [Anaerolineae bacterium]
MLLRQNPRLERHAGGEGRHDEKQVVLENDALTRQPRLLLDDVAEHAAPLEVVVALAAREFFLDA